MDGSMGISGGSRAQGAAGGALEAFLRLRTASRDRLAQKPQGAAQAPSAASAFAEAKAGVLKTASQYQRTGKNDAAPTGPRLGQYVDFRA